MLTQIGGIKVIYDTVPDAERRNIEANGWIITNIDKNSETVKERNCAAVAGQVRA